MLLNRRHLRIKVLQTLYSFSQHEDKDFLWARKELLKSIDQMYFLYILLLQIFPELKTKAEQRIEDNKKKLLPTEEDLNPNLKFVENQIIKIIEENAELRHQAETLKANWVSVEKQKLKRKLANQIRKSEVYFEFMNNGQSNFNDDKEFLIQLFKTEIANFPLLHDYLEEQSVYWMDDIDLICEMVIKTIKSFKSESELEKSEGTNQIFDLYKPENEEGGDEKEFITDLLRETINLRSENLEIIDSLTKNWELDRIAKMDVLLMELAITELVTFSNIPPRVTLNEYIEISKFYSTPKSNVFINGILDKAIVHLEDKGKIKKTGRGLMK